MLAFVPGPYPYSCFPCEAWAPPPPLRPPPRPNRHDVLCRSPAARVGTLPLLLSADEKKTMTASAAAAAAAAVVVSDDEDAPVKFGRKSYWDDMYEGNPRSDRPADSYSWYCGWNELAPFWTELVPNRENVRVLVPGTGNDATVRDLYDAGWTDLTAFDYSEAGVRRATDLLGNRIASKGGKAKVLHADARNLPFADSSFDAILDKGTLDAIYIAGKDSFESAVKELGRVTSPGGVCVSVSSVVLPEDLLGAFAKSDGLWENVHDGTLAFAPDGEATIDLGSELYSWRRRKKGNGQ